MNTKICFVSLKAYPIFNPKISSIFGGSEVQLYFIGNELANYENMRVNFLVEVKPLTKCIT